MIYIIHFQTPYKHAKHYLGYCDDSRLEQRIWEHYSNYGANLLKVVNKKGILWHVARVMPGDRTRERQIKDVCRKISQYCPHCSGHKAAPYEPLEYKDITREINKKLALWQFEKEKITYKALLWIHEKES